LRFRHLLEQHGLTQATFEEVQNLLKERRRLLRGHHRGRHHHRGAALDQECRGGR
jgi:hypothetical protein